MALTKKEDVTNEHEYVVLGLPSGTLWATCNVGAEKPEDYGMSVRPVRYSSKK